MGKSIQELEEEIRVRKLQEQHDKFMAGVERENKFRETSNIDVYASDDYAGMSSPEASFYFGYEETMCPKHKSQAKCEAYDCELSEWCFTATVNGIETMRVPVSKLYPKDGEEPLFYLVAGIAHYLNHPKQEEI